MKRHEDDALVPTERAAWTANRRVLMKASAAFAALGALGAGVGAGIERAVARPAAQAAETLARRWSEADETGGVSIAETGAGRVIEAEFPFYAVGASWDGAFGGGAALELSFSTDGVSFGSPVLTGPREDAGRPSRDNRVFVDLVFANGERFIRYRALDSSGAPIVAPGLEIVYIDASAGPSGGGVSAAGLTELGEPPVVSRAGWGANESYRFDAYGEIWPPEYREVEHVIIHHTATTNGQDPFIAIRNIYYYHAVESMWGDIGYNFLVAPNGTIFEGRIGGPHVVGGHAYKYAYGSSGIGTLGDFRMVDVSASAQAALIALSAWIGRNLQPLGKSTFHEAANLPTICGHRDVSQSSCPGDQLWNDLPAIRNAVTDLLEETTSPPDDPVPPFPPDTYKTGDNVVTDRAMQLRFYPSQSSASLQSLAAGTYCAIYGLPRLVDGQLWYYVLTTEHEGYLLGQYLDPAPIGNPPAPKPFKLGDRVRVTSAANMRRDPGLPQRIVGTLPTNAIVTITRESVGATGLRWWGVYDPVLTGGWVSQEFLTDAGLPKLNLSRPSSIPGITVGFTVSGFPANTSVAIQFDGSTKARVTTNGSGSASGQYKIPSCVKGGHTFRAVAGSSSATAVFEVLSTITFAPKEAPISTPLEIVCRGYAAGEDIEIQWQDGNAWVGIKTKTSGALGSMKTQITVPIWAAGPSVIRGAGPIGDAQREFLVTSGATVTEEETPAATPTAEATATPEPVETASPDPTETATPEPTATETATATPAEPTPEPTATTTPDATEEPAGPHEIARATRSRGAADADLVLDGDLTTVWYATGGQARETYLQLDLGRLAPVGEIHWHPADESAVAGLVISVAADRREWTPLTIAEPVVGGQWQITPAGVEARYIRFAFPGAVAGAVVGGLAEIEVW